MTTPELTVPKSLLVSMGHRGKLRARDRNIADLRGLFRTVVWISIGTVA